MITVQQKYKLNGSAGASTVYYTMQSDDTCVAVTPASGSVTPGTTVEFTFTFADTSCFATNFTLITYDDDCATPVPYVFAIANPCSTLDTTISNVPSATNPFIFTNVPSGGTPGYTTVWSYSTVLFSLVSKNDSKLELSLGDVRGLPPSATISATVTDSKGCTTTDTYVYTFCEPVGHNDFVTLVCLPTTTVSGTTVYTGLGNVELTATTCPGTTNDWSTLQLSYDTTKLLILQENEFLAIYGKASLTSATSYPISFSVANSLGIRSAVKTLSVQIPICQDSTNSVVVQNKVTKLVTGDTTGTMKYLDVEDLVFTSNT